MAIFFTKREKASCPLIPPNSQPSAITNYYPTLEAQLQFVNRAF
jgi:hypothetical protein